MHRTTMSRSEPEVILFFCPTNKNIVIIVYCASFTNKCLRCLNNSIFEFWEGL